MKYFITHIIILALAIAYPYDALCQAPDTKMDQLAERLATGDPMTIVYIRPDKETYLCGEDLWFNAFVLNAQDFTSSGLDKTLYVQLKCREKDTTVWREMYPVNSNGVSSGKVYLPQTLPEGDYILEAYSVHSAFFYKQRFYSSVRVRLVSDLKRIRNKSTGITKTVEGQNGDIQFGIYPEGGNLVTGLQGVVAFKAVNKDGSFADVSGSLLKDNAPIVNFTTAHAGMGSFVFTPERGAKFSIVLKNKSNYIFPVTDIRDSGIVMSLLKNEGDSLVFRLGSNYTNKKKIFIRLQIRGMVQAIAAGALKDSLIIKIPIANCPQGIAEATLFDEQLQPLAERLVYVHPEKKLSISVSPEKERFAPKEKVSLKIKTTDENGNAVPSILNMRVYDEIFGNPGNTSNIVNYCYLSSQLRGRIYDPSWYFDSSNKDRLKHLDVLLLTQGWRKYIWNEAVLKDPSLSGAILPSDSLPAFLSPLRKQTKSTQPVPVMFFNYNKNITQVGVTDDKRSFFLTPENLTIGTRFFVKYFSDDEYGITVNNPFDTLDSFNKTLTADDVFSEKISVQESSPDTSDLLQYGKTLAEVIIKGKGYSSRDKYLGYLDSIAKYENNTDYVGACGVLNCPACSEGTRPVEGVVYSELTESKRSRVFHHPYSFTANEIRKVTYHYPQYSEEELLKKFKMAIVKGYYQSKVFYEPDYDVEDRSLPDNRNVIAQDPEIITGANGEAVISFFCSDIRSRFTGIVEGVGQSGLLGSAKVNFTVR
ncbi:hypothetical protein [Agriterribacter sp.]|mgnify:CR=1 FL=1|uniref:hypothetical protein n=1 Tax=Agriterribacter sp. TaxID=2821509 RepID=UPI002BC70D62|nr:hypothetical protein [Agriterribacter sp.]HRP54994.1 hypothetical protein [Agriterribacter sp.]